MTASWPETSVLYAEHRDDGVVLITIDSPGERHNTLGPAAIDDATRLLEAIEAERGVTGVIFRSGKPGSFVAGADVNMIAACANASEASQRAETGQRVFGRIAALELPTVAAIDGLCLGGGLELALACDYRLATDAAHTRLGLPEVQLGLTPGSGGTQRLPRRIGLAAALDLMLTGRQVAARKARKLGLVDETVPPIILLEAALKAAREGARPPRPKAAQRLVRWGTGNNALGRRLVAGQARRTAARKGGGHYPAPLRIIDCAERGLADGLEKGLTVEAKAFGELAMTPEATELMGIYFATTAMKKDPGVSDPDVEPRPVQATALLGAGTMGAGIAQVTADRAATPVRLKDVSAESLSRALRQITSAIEGRVRRGSQSAFEGELARRRVTPTLDFSGFAPVDLVFEAVFEELELKHGMLADVERHCGPETMFASNTSAIPIADIAGGAERPENVLGMHYFSPVERMPLVEIIAHPGTESTAVAAAVKLGRAQGKTPIVVGDGAGFYVNRILAPYLNEAAHLFGEGVEIARIDRALVRFGFPVGPFKLLDEVGLDIAEHVSGILYNAFGERMRPSPITERMVADQRLGRKNSRGFYRYSGRRPGKRVDEGVRKLVRGTVHQKVEDTEIVDRTVLPLINEAVRCLDDGVLRSARDGDIGAVFGIGFPPFRGGPFRYIERGGSEAVRERLRALQEAHGERFEPAPGIAGGDRQFRPVE